MPLPPELENSSTQPLELDPNGPEVQEAVKAFLKEKQSETAPSETPTPAAPQNVAVQPNTDFDNQTPPQDALVNEAFLDLRKVIITTEEKEAYVKAVCTGEPFRLSIPMFHGNYVVELRTRSHYEQRRVYDAANLVSQEPGVPEDKMLQMALKITRFQQYCAAIMVERINGQLFSELTLKPGRKLEEDAQELLAFAQVKFDGMGQIQVMAIINAMRIFETKCAQLASEAHNENFWIPRDSER